MLQDCMDSNDRWVIVDVKTREVALETDNRYTADAVNQRSKSHKAIPVKDWLKKIAVGGHGPNTA